MNSHDLVVRDFYKLIQYQASLEGIVVTIHQTKDILDGLTVSGLRYDEVLTIRNLSRAWRFILEYDGIVDEIDIRIVTYMHHLLAEGLVGNDDLGRLRTSDVAVTGSKYRPKIPNMYEYNNQLLNIRYKVVDSIDYALELFCYIARTQGFIDVNKRTAFLVANLVLVTNDLGYLKVPKNLSKFRDYLLEYYNTGNNKCLKTYLKRYGIVRK